MFTPNATLVDSALAIIPRLLSPHNFGWQQIKALQTVSSSSSVYVRSQLQGDTAAVYFESRLVFPGAAETRIIREERTTDHRVTYYWSVILTRENFVRSLDEGLMLNLYCDMAHGLERKFPLLRKEETPRPITQHVTTRLRTLFTGAAGYAIGVEAWYDKIGRRNTCWLFSAVPEKP